jgi:HTTM domain
MTTIRLRTFEARAIDSYGCRAADLAVFRILYASLVLVMVVPVATWLPLAPRAFFNPPIGPAALFTAPPPLSVVLGLNVLLSLFAAMLLVGWRTGVASAGTGLTLLALDSWAYSLGHITHDILMVVTPLVLGFSAWGRALSVDAARRRRPARERAEAWPIALLALLVGFAMFTAGWAKATTGWLDPELRCSYGHLVFNYLFTGRETWAAKLAVRVDSDWFWKVADWAAVALELAFLPAAVHRRPFCLILAVATLFHLWVLLLFDISFGANILVYGAFVRYTELPLFRTLGSVGPLSRPMAVIAFAVGVVATLGGETPAVALHIPGDEVVVWAGAVVGTGYIFWTVWGWGRRFSLTKRCS